MLCVCVFVCVVCAQCNVCRVGFVCLCVLCMFVCDCVRVGWCGLRLQTQSTQNTHLAVAERGVGQRERREHAPQRRLGALVHARVAGERPGLGGRVARVG